MTESIDREAIIAALKREALSDPSTGWLSDLARRGLAWEERDDIIAIGDWYGSVDVGHLAEVVDRLVEKTTKPLMSRLKQAEQAVQRVREVHRPVSDPFGVSCAACIGDSRRSPYPCDTIRALDGDGRG